MVQKCLLGRYVIVRLLMAQSIYKLNKMATDFSKKISLKKKSV